MTVTGLSQKFHQVLRSEKQGLFVFAHSTLCLHACTTINVNNVPCCWLLLTFCWLLVIVVVHFLFLIIVVFSVSCWILVVTLLHLFFLLLFALWFSHWSLLLLFWLACCWLLVIGVVCCLFCVVDCHTIAFANVVSWSSIWLLFVALSHFLSFLLVCSSS